jgi:hypothetical protein
MAASGGVMQLSPSELNDHRQCRFGHWYYGYGHMRYGKLAEFLAIESVHREVHRIGPEIVRLRERGDASLIHDQIRKLLCAKDQILDYLQQLQRAVAGKCQPEGSSEIRIEASN